MKIGSHEEIRLRYEWHGHTQFLDLMQSGLTDIVDDFALDMKEDAEQIEDEYVRAQYFESLTEDLLEFERYQVILKNSYFVSACSLFEDHLHLLCRFAKRLYPTSHDVEDTKEHRVLTKAKLYLKELGITTPFKSPEWNQINHYQRMRNAIVHNGGRISKCWPSYAFCNNANIVSGDSNPYDLTLTEDFCKKASETFQRFLLMSAEDVRQQCAPTKVTRL